MRTAVSPIRRSLARPSEAFQTESLGPFVGGAGGLQRLWSLGIIAKYCQIVWARRVKDLGLQG